MFFSGISKQLRFSVYIVYVYSLCEFRTRSIGLSPKLRVTSCM